MNLYREPTIEERLVYLEDKLNELIMRDEVLGKQITEMKELYEKTLIEVTILKQGGNI